ncbi:MAG: PilZ domain-containing protein [Planctomycetaceae bacterium]
MSQSLTRRYAEVVQRSFVPSQSWTWPRERQAGDVAPDCRLLEGSLPALTAFLTLPSGASMPAHVRSVSHHDLVMTVGDLNAIPVMGQVIDVTLLWNEWRILNSAKAILHWSGSIERQGVIAVFTIDSMGKVIEQWMNDNSRGEIRFPVNLPAVVSVGPGQDVVGRIVDYSLGGCRFLASESIDLDRDYPMTVQMPNASVRMTLHPRWSLNTEDGWQLGCTFEPEQGVLLACRHHPQPTGFSSPLRPVTSVWTSRSDD